MASFNEIVDSEKPVLIDFTAAWCGPCQMLAPILEELSSEIGDAAKIIKIDVDKNQAVAQKFQIRGVPTLMIFKKGEMLWRESGVKSKAELKNLLAKYA
ncbi:MAG: thioredoxin [Bernardetiaceae bacterium]|nr:thioredoxin [Bernardetiaceae bacterium]